MSTVRQRGYVRFALALAVVAATTGGSAPAETLRVPSEYATIRAAVAASTDGDVVLLATGVYSGPDNRNIDFEGRAITVTSESGAALTIMDIGEIGRGFQFYSGEGPGSVVEGLTIRGGQKNWLGGAIAISASSPTIRGCVIAGNKSIDGFFGLGGGIACRSGASPLIESCTVSRNSSWNDNDVDAGGLFVDGPTSTVTLSKCIVYGNCDGDIFLSGGATLRLDCCIIGDLDPGTGVVEEITPTIYEDPMFCNVPSCVDPHPDPFAFRVQGGSPALPEYNECGVLIGAVGGDCSASSVAEVGFPRAWIGPAFPTPTTDRVSFAVSTGKQVLVSAVLLDAGGRMVRSSVDQAHHGSRVYEFDLRGEDGRAPAPGVYFARWCVDGTSIGTSRIVVVR